MGKNKNLNEAERFFRLLKQDGSLTPADELGAYKWFTGFFESRARKTLFKFDEPQVLVVMSGLLASLLTTFGEKEAPENPEAYLTTAVANALKTLYGDKSDANRIVTRKKYVKILQTLENEGRIYSNRIDVSVSKVFYPSELREEAIYGYIDALSEDDTVPDAEFIYELLESIGQPVDKDLLLNQLVNYSKGIKVTEVKIDGDENPEIETPDYEAKDTGILPDEELEIKDFMDNVMSEVAQIANSDKKLSEEVFIKLLYLSMGDKTSKEIGEIVKMTQKNVEYYISERASKAMRILVKRWTNELTALLEKYSRETILTRLEDELTVRLKEKYHKYLQGIN
ncbi:MAG: hypothetical protein J0L60_14150 [Ignavibacteria bacterium]|nr:hypothetical protein [Ignavibacteria bacterium]